MTGKMILPSTGAWTFNLTSDEGAQMWVNGQLIIDDWKDNQTSTTPTSSQLDTHPTGIFTNTTANAMIDVVIKYYHLGGDANFALTMTPPGGSSTNQVASYFTPDYSLTTNDTTDDATYGNTTTTTSYGASPQLGLASSTTVDPSGADQTTSNTYETPGTGFLRQTSQTSPDGATTDYSYYSATTTEANPCVSGSTAAYQGGMLEAEIDPSPGGSTSGKTITYVYDKAGNIVTQETNSDGWTCNTYDARGRMTEQVIPAFNGATSRTITYNYDVGGNPLITSETDNSGTITTTTDLLGRTVSYEDSQGDTTTTAYDNLGRESSQTSAMGTETYSYNNYNEQTDEKLGSTDLAWSSYDQYGRLTGVSYPSAGTLSTSMSYDPVTGAEISESDNLSGGTPGSNLVENPSFEQHTVNASLPDDWTEDNWATNTAVFSYPSNGHTGSYSARVDMSGYSSGDAKWDTAPMTVSPSTNYTFSDYYESNVSTIVDAKITHTDGSVTYTQIGAPAASGSGWAYVTYNFTTPSDATQVVILHLIQSNGYLQIDDMSLNQNSTPLSESDTNTLSQSGKITQGVVSNGSSSLTSAYTYDASDQLTAATIGSNAYSYGYGTENSSCASGTNTSAGLSDNRTSMSINGTSTWYCYNGADQLVSSSNSAVNAATYDAHGNMTEIGSNGDPLYLTYDASDRNMSLVQYNSSGNGSGMYYNYDADGRISYRENDTISGWNWNLNSQDWYGYTDSSDSPAFSYNASWQIAQEYVSLPGGITVTIYPQKRTTAKAHNSQVVFGMVERGGRAHVKHVKSSGVRVLSKEIAKE
jgi:YD repeat-containing protein